MPSSTRSGGPISRLTDADIRLATAAAAKLYEGEQAKIGDFEDWANPESGNQGSVMLVGIFTHNDLPCRRLQHDIEIATSGTPFRYVFDRCKLPTGEWEASVKGPDTPPCG